MLLTWHGMAWECARAGGGVQEKVVLSAGCICVEVCECGVLLGCWYHNMIDNFCMMASSSCIQWILLAETLGCCVSGRLHALIAWCRIELNTKNKTYLSSIHLARLRNAHTCRRGCGMSRHAVS
jgi:hypothetical protein